MAGFCPSSPGSLVLFWAETSWKADIVNRQRNARTLQEKRLGSNVFINMIFMVSLGKGTTKKRKNQEGKSSQIDEVCKRRVENSSGRQTIASSKTLLILTNLVENGKYGIVNLVENGTLGQKHLVGKKKKPYFCIKIKRLWQRK